MVPWQGSIEIPGDTWGHLPVDQASYQLSKGKWYQKVEHIQGEPASDDH